DSGRDAQPTCSRQLALDPLVSARETSLQAHPRLPAQHLAQPGVVRVASADALRLGQVVALVNRLAGDIGDDVHQLVDGYQTVGAEVQRSPMVAAHQAIDPLDAVGDVTVRASLLAVAPHFDRLTVLGQRDLAADSGR